MMMDIFVHTEDNQILQQRFSAEDTVLSVEKSLNSNKPIILLHKNKILIPQFSLSFYHINNGDHLYALNQPPNLSMQTIRNQLFEQKIINEAQKEAVRLKDLIYNKIDSTPQYYCRIVKRFNAIIQQEEQNQPIKRTPTFIPNRPSSISSTALPKFW